MPAPSDEENRVLARMVGEPEKFWSAPSLGTTTMVMRKMTEAGLVEMSLSAKGLPFYQITETGELAVVKTW